MNKTFQDKTFRYGQEVMVITNNIPYEFLLGHFLALARVISSVLTFHVLS